ncbi:NAD(P)/FAD-dependent oxidoreductase [Temperatibacter marinus]|uniref:Pyridine nucleotide-disulfide oxidoreductase domain-containing protein 2 n=1 Tax=Temperatibacter marinus TaxID=1456591 RepID=A0AA52HAT2_9PROT|nr:NAD(P)/FAD-dependent oxidoreductase [Temperatibacter marinus]WND02933.1 NAD(P)/FAD-dependent oxidoreductase [Temperatibacter marinus]
MTEQQTYDAILIGAGHNGLICASYLAKAGKKVLVLEAQEQVGGAARSEKLNGQYTLSPCAQFLGPLEPKIEKDFGLSMNKNRTVHDSLFMTENADPISIRDGNLSGDLSAKDLKEWPAYHKQVCEYASVLKVLLTHAPIDLFNADWEDKKTALKLGWKLRFGLGKDGMREFLRIAGMNIYDWLDERFESPELKGAIAFDACLGHFAAPRSIGTVYTYLYRQATTASIGTLKGGMNRFFTLLSEQSKKLGVDIQTKSAVSNVIVEKAKAKGVTLVDGRQFFAPVIISNADPKTTVLDIVGPRHFEADFVKGIDNIRMQGTTAKLHLLLENCPDFNGLDQSSLTNRLVLTDTIRNVERAFDPIKYGSIAKKPLMEVHIPTLSDPSLAPKGHHILSATISYVPYKLKGGWHAEAKMNLRKACIDHLALYAPDIHRSIIHAELYTPVDIEKKFGLKGGHWHHGEMALDQLMMMRPTPGAAQYSLPLDGLYLCGAGAHPGGSITGLPGKLAAEVVLSDLSKGELS